VLACGGEPSRARIGIALEPGWYPAMTLALEDLGTVPLEVIADSTRNVQLASSAMAYGEWLADQGVALVVGHSGSRGSVAASTIYQQRGVVQLAPMATSRELTRAGSQALALVPDDSVEGAVIAQFAAERLRASRVALLYHHDEYGLGIRDGVVAELARRGIDVVDERFFAPEGTPSGSLRVERLLAAALRSRPDAIILGARVAETRSVVAYLRRRGLQIPVVAGDGSYVLPPTAQGRRLHELDGVHIVRFWGPDIDSASVAFARRFEGRFGYPPEQSDAFTYDAVMLAGTAARAGARTPEQFRRYLEGLGTREQSHVGLGGVYVFDRGRPRYPLIEVATVRNGVLAPNGGVPAP
jgi:branched-chain amino acid transport system substrate-binding protein